jgi:PAS domain S-box-containing protein
LASVTSGSNSDALGGDADAAHAEEPTGQESGRTTAASAPEVGEALKMRAMDEAPVGITIADATRPDMPLVYVNAAFERITGYSPEYAVGRNCRFLQGEDTRSEPVARMRAAIEAEESVSVELRNYRRDGELFWNEVTIAPLRDADGDVVYYVGFQQDVTRRKRAERAATRRAKRLERERTAQERLLTRLDGVIVDVTETVAEAGSRSQLEGDVAESLAETYDGVWIGTYDPAAEAVVPRASAGSVGSDGPPERVAIDGDEAGRTAVADAVSGAIGERRVRTGSLDDGVTAVAGVPLHYGEAIYGAVCVYVGDGDDLDDHERAVLTAVGRIVATGINTLESHRTLHAQDAIELRFTVREHPLIELADRAGVRLFYAGNVADRDRPTTLFELRGADAAAVREAATDAGVDLQAVLVEDGTNCLVELALPEAGLRELLAEYGATLLDASVDEATATVTVEVARESLGRSMAEAVTERFDDAELDSYRRRERRDETRGEFVATMKRDLTDRQYAALVRAYTGGFFEWPHEATGEDLAAAMDISRSTFHQHLRAAERKLIGAILDEEGERGYPN